MSKSQEVAFNQDWVIKKYNNLAEYSTKLSEQIDYISICVILDSDIILSPQLIFR